MEQKLSDEPWANLLGSKLSDWQPLEIFFGVDMKNSKKPFSSIFFDGKIFPGEDHEKAQVPRFPKMWYFWVVRAF